MSARSAALALALFFAPAWPIAAQISTPAPDVDRAVAHFAMLHRVEVNVALNHVRDTKRGVLLPVDEADLITNTLGTARLVAREAKVRLLAALEELPPKQRMSVELRLFRDLSFAEVAREMDTSEHSAKSSYHHATKRLRTHLEDEETSTPAGNDAAHDVRK